MWIYNVSSLINLFYIRLVISHNGSHKKFAMKVGRDLIKAGKHCYK